jgi:hypothetical protein
VSVWSNLEAIHREVRSSYQNFLAEVKGCQLPQKISFQIPQVGEAEESFKLRAPGSRTISAALSPDSPSPSWVDASITTYRRRFPDLFPQYTGSYVAISAGEVLGSARNPINFLDKF